MRLRVSYQNGFEMTVEGVQMEDFVKSSIWKIRLSAVRRRSIGTEGQKILFPSSLAKTDVKKMLESLSALDPERAEVVFDSSFEEGKGEKDSLIREKAQVGLAIKAHSEQLIGEFKQFSAVVNSLMARPLLERQLWDAFYMCTMGKSANFSVPGSGKTATTLGMFAYLKSLGLVERLVVVGPKNSFGSWRDEWETCFGKAPASLCFHDSVWKGKTRAAKYQELRLNGARYDLILVNYEALEGYASAVQSLVSTSAMLVFDEVHKVKQVGGIRAKAALEAARGAKYVVALTGTPIPNSYVDIYNMLHLLYPADYGDYFGFTTSYLLNPGTDETAEINEALQPFFCRTNKQNLNVPEASPDRIMRVQATPEENELLGILKDEYKRSSFALIMRIMQLESNPQMLLTPIPEGDCFGFFDSDCSVDAEVPSFASDPSAIILIDKCTPSSKYLSCLAEVRSLASEGKSVVVWCFFKKSMYTFEHDLRAEGFVANVICGDTPQEDRDEILRAFKEDGPSILVTNPQTLAESVSLHSVCHDAVYFEYSYNLVHLLQSKDRIHRLGLKEGQYTQYLFMQTLYSLAGKSGIEQKEWSLDENIYKRLEEKEQRMLQAIDRGVLEPGDTDESDLRMVFNGLFEEEQVKDGLGS